MALKAREPSARARVALARMVRSHEQTSEQSEGEPGTIQVEAPGLCAVNHQPWSKCCDRRGTWPFPGSRRRGANFGGRQMARSSFLTCRGAGNQPPARELSVSLRGFCQCRRELKN